MLPNAKQERAQVMQLLISVLHHVTQHCLAVWIESPNYDNRVFCQRFLVSLELKHELIFRYIFTTKHVNVILSPRQLDTVWNQSDMKVFCFFSFLLKLKFANFLLRSLIFLSDASFIPTSILMKWSTIEKKKKILQEEKQSKLTVDIQSGRRHTPCTVWEPSETPPAPPPAPTAASGLSGCAVKSEGQKKPRVWTQCDVGVGFCQKTDD